MLGGGFKAERLRVNLRLVINRLKLLEKKKSESRAECGKKTPLLHIMRNQWPLVHKTNVFSVSVLYPVTTLNLFLLIQNKAELAQKARKEIADYLSSGKDERARIRVEHIIREDYLVEAMEILELYCDLLLARFGLIQSMK